MMSLNSTGFSLAPHAPFSLSSCLLQKILRVLGPYDRLRAEISQEFFQRSEVPTKPDFAKMEFIFHAQRRRARHETGAANSNSDCSRPQAMWFSISYPLTTLTGR